MLFLWINNSKIKTKVIPACVYFIIFLFPIFSSIEKESRILFISISLESFSFLVPFIVIVISLSYYYLLSKKK